MGTPRVRGCPRTHASVGVRSSQCTRHAHAHREGKKREGRGRSTYARREGRVDGIDTYVYTPTVHDPTHDGTGDARTHDGPRRRRSPRRAGTRTPTRRAREETSSFVARRIRTRPRRRGSLGRRRGSTRIEGSVGRADGARGDARESGRRWRGWCERGRERDAGRDDAGERIGGDDGTTNGCGASTPRRGDATRVSTNATERASLRANARSRRAHERD